jgi:CubicO group peptidase (beta-lactamase class C family)
VSLEPVRLKTQGLPPSKLAEIVRTYRSKIPQLMESNHLPGLALALVDRSGPLWVEGFGHLDSAGRAPVDENTMFSLQSTSKVVTTVAILTAVRDGLLDLDAPITRYLPEFTVQSRFEEHPERHMTLRLLLSHRAGFTHEAPVGNNYVPEFESFEAHIKSIQRTWLRYPVGSHHAYSNLGIDLAGYILSVVSGKSFPQYVKEKVLDPLGMTNSSYDWQAIETSRNHAIGHWALVGSMPLRFALIPSGGLYASAKDMGAFLTFQLNDGRVDRKQVLEASLLYQMRNPDFAPGQDLGYGLGLRRYEQFGLPYFEHSGAGFGFKSHFSWYPALDVGIVVLTNSMDQNLVHQIGREIITAAEAEVAPGGRNRSRPFADLEPLSTQPLEAERLRGVYLGRGSDRFSVVTGDEGLAMEIEGETKPLYFVSATAAFIDWGGGKRELFRFDLDSLGRPQVALRVRYGWTYDFDHAPGGPPPGPDKPEWDAYLGRYEIILVDRVLQEVEVKRQNGYLVLDDNRLVLEYLPGLLFDSRGEALDFRSDPPTWANIPLRRVER